MPEQKRGPKIGPIIAKAISDGIALAENDADAREDYETAEEWLLQEIAPVVVPARDDDTEKLLADTPSLFGATR